MNLQNPITSSIWQKPAGALIGLARAAEGKELTPNTIRLLYSGLSSLAPGYALTAEGAEELTGLLHKEKDLLAPDCASCQSPCGRTADYTVADMWKEAEAMSSLRFLLFTGLTSIACAAWPALLSGASDEALTQFLLDGLFMTGYAYEEEQLTVFLKRIGGMYQRARVL